MGNACCSVEGPGCADVIGSVHLLVAVKVVSGEGET